MKKVIQVLGITLGLVAVFGCTSNSTIQNAEYGETFAPKVQDNGSVAKFST